MIKYTRGEIMVDIQITKEIFNEYTNKFNIKDEKLNNKINHSYRVSKICKELAKSLNLTEEKIEIAELIGLLHDIGRFEQYTKFKTFRDKESIDHGNLGKEILEKNNYIRKYIMMDQYDKIIIKAIENHNKYKIDENVSKEEKIFCNIIRDADKLDIFYEAKEIFWNGLETQVQNEKISEKIFEEFEAKKQVNNILKKNQVDNLVGIISFIYDLNIKESFRIIKENDYINKIINRFNFFDIETKNKIEEIRKMANNFIEQKINEG